MRLALLTVCSLACGSAALGAPYNCFVSITDETKPEGQRESSRTFTLDLGEENESVTSEPLGEIVPGSMIALTLYRNSSEGTLMDKIMQFDRYIGSPEQSRELISGTAMTETGATMFAVLSGSPRTGNAILAIASCTKS